MFVLKDIIHLETNIPRAFPDHLLKREREEIDAKCWERDYMEKMQIPISNIELFN